MAQQTRMPGNADVKRKSWHRGKGTHSMRGELKHGIAIRKNYLNRRVRHDRGLTLKGSLHRRKSPTLKMVNFS